MEKVHYKIVAHTAELEEKLERLNSLIQEAQTLSKSLAAQCLCLTLHFEQERFENEVKEVASLGRVQA